MSDNNPSGSNETGSNESVKRTVIVALVLCIVCSVIVSAAAVMLKPLQDRNKKLDIRTSVLATAGMLKKGESPDQIEKDFSQFEVKLVDLNTGEYVDPHALGLKNAAAYDQRRASKDPKMSRALSSQEDIASIKRQANIAKVYILREDGQLKRVILPVHGYGLWSTLWGFLALKGDANTVVGLRFYQEAETPGLGGEVENPKWMALWPGKKIYGEDNMTDPKVRLVKGGVQPDSPDAKYEVDALSGATLTSRGVTNLLQFWLSKQGFATYLKKLRAGEV